MLGLIDPLEITVEDQGISRQYVISKFPAVAGREIIAGYPMTSLPKIGDYKHNEELMLKLLSYVAAFKPENNETIRLTTRALVDNHVPSWEMLMKIEMQMLEYNCSFFKDGRISNFLRDSVQKLPQWISKIVTASLEQLSPKEKPPSTN